MNREITVLDEYTKRVYKIIMFIIPTSCLAASITITALHYMGFYAPINKTLMWIFNVMDLMFLGIGIFFIKNGFGEDGMVKKEMLFLGKYTAALIAIIQWNAISYIWPFRDFWAFILLFILGEAFFFDLKLVGFTSAGLVVSTIISWFINGEYLLPVKDEYFISNMTFRVICLIFSIMCINILTFFGGKFLVEELEKYVYNDPLTRLLTRRKLDSYMNQAYADVCSGQKNYCVLMIDIDDFKKVNDTYGHDCGDEVLKHVSGIISTCVSNKDKVFRWGGEEILVLLEEERESAVSSAERIRAQINKHAINYRGEVDITVTVTIGLSELTVAKGIRKAMDEADSRLYSGKHNGKDQVVYV